MIDVKTTFLWKIQSGVDAKVCCNPVLAPFSRTQSEFSLAFANEGSAGKYYLADMGVSTPMSALSFTGNTSLPQS